MFMARLKEARAEAKAECKVLSPKPEGQRRREEEDARAGSAAAASAGGRGGGGGGEQGRGAEDARADGKEPTTAATRPDAATILELVSEYLFDLFDANCMDEFRTLDDFQERAMDAFDPDVEEFTFEQQRLHGEFCDMFEGFCEKYIRDAGYTMDEFYEVVRQAKEKSDAKAGADTGPPSFHDDPDHAVEVVETIYGCSDFRAWAEHMRSISEQRRDFLRRKHGGAD